MNLFNLPEPRRQARRQPAALDALPLLAATPCRPSRWAVEAAIFQGYAQGSITAGAVAALLAVPVSSPYVETTLGAIADARRVLSWRSSVPHDVVQSLAVVVLRSIPVDSTAAPLFGGAS